MARLSLRRYDHQAILSVAISLGSIVTMLGLAFLIFRHMEWQEMVIYYGTKRRAAILAATAVTAFLSAVGLGLGLNSVGQRRNEKQKLSWLGFFLGAGVLTMTMILFFLFMDRGESAVR